MRWLALDDLDRETVRALFLQAVITHPKVDGSDSHCEAGWMEFAALLTAELEGRLNERMRRTMGRAFAEVVAEGMRK